jgi:type VI secretion system protein ImpL
MHVLYLITGVSLGTYVVAAWVAGKLLGLSGREFYILFALLTALGTLAAGAFVWWKMKSAPIEDQEETEPAEAVSDNEIDLLIRDAENKLAAARLAQGSKIGNLPLLFIMGDQGSTKSTVIVNSGLEPELLAGQVYHDNMIVSTRAANLWFANGTIFTEVAPQVTSDATAWTRAIRSLRPRTLKSVVGGNAQAPRSALVCVNAELFTQPGASEKLGALARSLQTQLGKIAETLGIRFPVYVLFTRCDRLPFFADYVRTLTNEEAGQPVGVTLPMRAGAAGVYAEEESQRLSAAFNSLFHSLSDHRVDFLPRESDLEKVPGAFEFPREFRKLRTPLVQFLVDVCRPSQLRTSPFLRGFYFCGVRPVTIQETAISTSTAKPTKSEAAGSATGVFHVQSAAAPQPAAQPQYVGTKRVPQWLFLTRLFHNVILQDRAALSTSGASTKTSMTQRILLASAAVLCLGIAAGFTVSFFRNRALVTEAGAASRAFPGSVDAAGPAVPDLQKLATLRGVLQRLTDYRANGRPFSMGWGLYAGDELYPAVRANYYKRFAQLLFGSAQGALRSHMAALPASPAATDDFGTSYDVLKGYLITTSHSNRASADSPAPILLRKWSETRNIQDQRKELANAEFQFYAADLKNGNPYSTEGDRRTVERTRDYLNAFSGIERVYQYMLSSAGKKPVNYNRDIPGSSQAVINNRDVPGAFTKDGYAFMQDALLKADKYFGGEPWVLERARRDNVDTSKLSAELGARYVNDFVTQWRNYFRNTSVLRYSSLEDASKKLNLHTSTQSPILGVFWLASQNTGVDYSKIPGADRIRRAFQPVHRVVPPGSAERYSAPTNKSYMDGLLALQQSIDGAKSAPTPDAAAIINSAANAKLAVRQMALEFDIDEARLNNTVQRLLEEPITSAEDLVKSLGPRELNSKGKGFCDTYDPVFRKLPFNPNATAEATLQEVNALLKPGEGALWQFYQANLQKGLVKVGPEYRANGELPLTPAYVNFFNNAARLSEAFYRSGGEPRLTYSVRALKSDDLQDLAIVLDGQSLEASSGQTKQMTSPGSNPASYFKGKVGGADLQPMTMQTGLWSAFKLLNSAEKMTPAGAGYNLDWFLELRFGGARVSGANPPTARFYVDLGGATILLKRAGGGLTCVRQVAK